MFCDNRDKLLEDIRKLLTEEGDELRYSQFLSHMEHAPRSIDQSMSPVWKGMARCRCWWDARDHLQAVVDYLQDMLSSTTSRQSKRIWAVVIALIGVVIAAVTNLATSIVPNTLLPYLWLSWPLLVILVIISLALVYYSN
jgi:hypothetical protein